MENPAFQIAFATAAFAAATAATSAHQFAPSPGWTYPLPYQQPQPQLVMLHDGIQHPAASLQMAARVQRAQQASELASATSQPTETTAPVTLKVTEGSEALQAAMQLLVQQHALELEARRMVERELHDLREKYDALVATSSKAELECAVAVANSKAAEKAAKEKDTAIGRLEEQAAEWRKLATDLLKERKPSSKEKSDR